MGKFKILKNINGASTVPLVEFDYEHKSLNKYFDEKYTLMEIVDLLNEQNKKINQLTNLIYNTCEKMEDILNGHIDESNKIK